MYQKKFYAFITHRENDYVPTRWKIRGGLKLLQMTVRRDVLNGKLEIRRQKIQSQTTL